MTHCVYASPSIGVHDRRWIAALSERGWRPVAVHRDTFPSDSAFAAAVATASDGAPVLAGPLPLAATLLEVGASVTLLSWGFDLHAPDAPLEAVPRFACVIVDSSATRAIAEAQGAQGVVLLPWGVDLYAFATRGPVADLSSMGVDASERVVLSLRAHEPLYRIDDIVSAFAEVPLGARLVIGHHGSGTAALRAQAERLDVDAVFLGSLEEEALPALLRRAAAYVTASEIDGASVTLLQAMACGVPVAASANPGNADWVADGATGFVFPVGDARALASAIARALDAAPAVTQAARAQVEARADWHRNIARLDDALHA